MTEPPRSPPREPTPWSNVHHCEPGHPPYCGTPIECRGEGDCLRNFVATPGTAAPVPAPPAEPTRSPPGYDEYFAAHEESDRDAPTPEAPQAEPKGCPTPGACSCVPTPEAPQADDLAARVRERVLPKHGGTADSWTHHWNLTDLDSELHALAAARIESDAKRIRELEAENERLREQRGTLICSGSLAKPEYTPLGQMIRDIEAKLAASRERERQAYERAAKAVVDSQRDSSEDYTIERAVEAIRALAPDTAEPKGEAE